MTKDDDTTPAKKASQPLREISEPGQNQKICEHSCTFSTPGAAGRLSLNMPTSDMSPASRRDLIHKTNEQIVRALNRRQVTDSAVKRELAFQLEHAKADTAKLNKMLTKTRGALVRSSVNSEVLASSVPGAHMGELARRDQKIEQLEWETGCLKAQLGALEEGLKLRANGHKPGPPAAGVNNTGGVISPSRQHQRNEQAPADVEERLAAMAALLEQKGLLVQEQRERIEDLEAELENAQSAAWEQREMQQQLEAAVHEAHAKISTQSREVQEQRQELEQLEASLEGAEDYIAELEEKLMAADGGSKA